MRVSVAALGFPRSDREVQGVNLSEDRIFEYELCSELDVRVGTALLGKARSKVKDWFERSREYVRSSLVSLEDENE